MAYTLEQLNALDEAISQGAVKVEYGDKKVTYRSLTEMMQLRNLMATELGLIKPAAYRKYGEFHSGFSSPGDNNNYIE